MSLQRQIGWRSSEVCAIQSEDGGFYFIMSGVDCVLIQGVNKPIAVNATCQSAGNNVILVAICYSE